MKSATTTNLPDNLFVQAPATAQRYTSLFDLLSKVKVVLPQKPSGIDAFGIDDFDDETGVELEEDVDNPAEPTHGHFIELEEDDEFVITLAKKKCNFISTIGDLTKISNPQIDWIFPGMLREGSVCLLVGHPGAGKSSIILKLLDAIAWGKSFLGHQCAKRPVLYLDRDGNSLGDIQDRSKWLGVKTGGNLKYFGSNVPEEDIPMPGESMVVEWVNSLSQRPVIVCDSLIKFLNGGEENSSTVVDGLWRSIDRLKRAGCSFVFLHHMSKNQMTVDPFRGSTAIKAGVDFAFTVENVSPAKKGLTDAKLTRLKTRNIAAFGNEQNELFVHISEQGDFSVGNAPKKVDKDEKPTVELGDKLLAICEANHGIDVREFEALVSKHGLGQKVSRVWRQAALKEGILVKRTGPKGRISHYTAASAPPKSVKAETNELSEGLRPTAVD